MEVWSGKPTDYSNLKIFGSFSFAHIKQDMLKARVVKCVFIGYPERVKDYKLWKMDPVGSKLIISKDVTFDETCMAMKCIDLEVKELEIMVEKTKFEVEVPTSETRDGEVVETHIPSTIEEQHTMSHNYQLARDRIMRETVPPQRYGYADLICYDLNVAKELQYSEPKTFKEALKSKESQRWLMMVNNR